MKLVIFLITALTFAIHIQCQENAKKALDDFEFDDEGDQDETKGTLSAGAREQALQESLLRAMQRPSLRVQIGEVIPILRVMSPQQRLTLAALVSAQIMAPQHADEQNLSEVAHMFSGPGQNAKNVSEQLLLPISMDIAKMFKGIATDAGRSWRSTSNSWHKDLGGFREPIKSGHFRPTTYRPSPADIITKDETPGKKQNVTPRLPNEINRRSGLGDGQEESPNSQDCDFLTSDICQEVSNYPEDQILGSIKDNLSLMEPFLTDFDGAQENPAKRIQRRRDDGTENALGTGEGYMCPSTIKYAKPKRARTTNGSWKYIVNTGDYTQTLRLEICLRSGSSCSYLNNNLKSTCNQVYNYHRLMCWDENRGLHMDVFKVPSCCSCHIQGYTGFGHGNQLIGGAIFADKRAETDNWGASSSGVKREIPRPNFFGGRPEGHSFQGPPKRPPLEFPLDEELQQPPRQPVRFPPHKNPQRNQPFPNVQQQQRQQQQQQQPFPPYTEHAPEPHLQQNSPVTFVEAGPPRVIDRQPQKPHPFQNNIELFGGPQKQEGLIDHLVPPGPPLPLDYDRPNPPFNPPRRNNTNRTGGNNIVMEQSTNLKRGTQEDVLVKPHSQPPRKRPPIRPADAINAQSENNRVQYKPTDGAFGSKIRPNKPNKQQTVFVTPAPLPAPEGLPFENAVKVTPKPQKNNQKKVNYNYHPIIDFFSRDGQHTQFGKQPQKSHPSANFNHPSQGPNNFQESPQITGPQFAQIQSNRQHVASPHEWTPML